MESENNQSKEQGTLPVELSAELSQATNDSSDEDSIELCDLANNFMQQQTSRLLANIIKNKNDIALPRQNFVDLRLRLNFADKFPNHVFDHDDIEQIWLAFQSTNPKLALLAKDLLLKKSCALNAEQKKWVILDSQKRFEQSNSPLHDLQTLEVDSFQTDDINYEQSIDTEASKAVEESILDWQETSCKLDSKSLDDCLSEMQSKNSKLNIAKLKELCELSEQNFSSLSQICRQTHNLKAINHWDKDDITNWAALVKAELEKAASIDFLPEIIAVVKRANFLFSKEVPENLGQGQLLRVTQVLSLLIFLSDLETGRQTAKENGKLLQISTGEGKSTITACLAVILSLMGRSVDIITSSKELAKRDANYRAKFFELFGLTSSHNCLDRDTYKTGVKECYQQDIVYGDASSFQFDLLRDSKGKASRGDRLYDIAIVDEVDSMCIDESSKIAMVASSVPGADYLGVIYAALVFHQSNLQKQITSVNGSYYYIHGPYEVIDNRIVLRPILQETSALSDEERISKVLDLDYFYNKRLTDVLNELLAASESLHLPTYLLNFILVQKDAWIKSIIRAQSLEFDADYVIKENAKGEIVAAPVDYLNTGSIHVDTQWNCGLHQFVQLKNGLKFHSESLTTSYISNSGLFLKYKNIYGMSGTLGSEDSQNLLSKVYNVSCSFMPTFKPKIFHKQDDLIAFDKIEHLGKLQENIKQQSANARAVLVICQTIKFAKILAELLKSDPQMQGKVSAYCTADSDGEDIFEKAIDVGQIIIATNLAGRGTDIKTTKGVEAAGGLHVILSFLPQNLRVEEQGFGRTSRQGNQGSAQMIINFGSVKTFLVVDEDREINIDYLKSLRNEQEQVRLLEHELYKAFIINKEDELYVRMRAFAQSLPKDDAKLEQLEENWGIFCRQVKEQLQDSANSSVFKDQVRALGYKAGSSKTSYFGSLYKALELQLKGLFSGQELMCMLLDHIFLQHKFAASNQATNNQEQDIGNDLNNDLLLKIPKLLKNSCYQDILQDFADILERDILLICNLLICKQQQEGQLIKSKSMQTGAPLTLSLFVDQFGQYFFESSQLLEEPQSIDTNIDINKEKLLQRLQQAKKGPIASYQKQIFEQAAQDDAKAINEKIASFLEKKFQSFIEETNQRYSQEDYHFISNPAYLVRKAINLFGAEDAKALHLLKLAQERDSAYSYSAHFNYAYGLIRQGGLEHRDAKKVDTAYMREAFRALQTAKAQITEDVIPNIEAISLLSKHIGQSLLSKQVIDRVDVLKLLIKHIDDVCAQIAACQGAEYIAIKSIKMLQDCYPPDSKPAQELNEMFAQGIVHIFDVESRSIDIDWTSGIIVCALGLLQVGLSLVVACTGNISIAASIAMSGINDFMTAKAVFNGAPLDWGQYFSAKGVQVAVQIFATGIAKVFSKMGLIKAGGGIFDSTKALTMQAALPKLASQMALNYTVFKGIDLAQQFAAEHLGKTFCDDLCSTMKHKLDNYFDDPQTFAKIHALLAADAANHNHNNINAIQRTFINALSMQGSKFKAIMQGSFSKASAQVMTGGNLAVGAMMCAGATSVAVNDVNDHLQEVKSQIQQEVERLYARVATPESYLLSTLKFSFRKKDIKSIIASLNQRGIIANGLADLGKLPSDISDCMGLADHIKDRSELIKARLRAYGVAMKSQKIKDQTHEFISQLKETMQEKAGRKVLGAVKDNFAMPLVSMIGASQISAFSDKLRDGLAHVLSSRHAREISSEMAANDNIAKDNANQAQLERAQQLHRQYQDRSSLNLISAGQNDDDAGQIDTRVKLPVKKQPKTIGKHIPLISKQNKRSIVFLPANDNVAKPEELQRSILFTPKQETYDFNLLPPLPQSSRPLFSLIPQAQASAGVMPLAPIFDISGAPFFELAALRALSSALPLALRALPAASAIATSAAVLHNTAQFQADHIWLDEDFVEMLNNPGTPQSIKDQWMRNIDRDPLLRKQEDAGKKPINSPIIVNYAGASERMEFRSKAYDFAKTTYSFQNQCEYYRALPSDELVREVATKTLVPTALFMEDLPNLYNIRISEAVFGAIKHKAFSNCFRDYREKCKDDRYRPEIVYYQKESYENTAYPRSDV